ncbi:MAG TPA: hypothetical protein VKZ96_18205 [Thermomicrobiales bacterium]|nr:hypothetical protein [Thermomicrobiales bacterium]
MNILKRIANTMRGYPSEGSLQYFYGALAVRNQEGGPRFSESKRDYEALRKSERYMII